MISQTSLVDEEELDRYERAVHAFLRLEMDPERFMSVRLQQGVYGQRQDGVHMIRVKLPGGRLRPHQLTAIADVLEAYARHNVVHVTTRTDIQIHYVPTADTPAALRRLAQAGLTTREACGNTVRNVTACPLAGVCPREHLDITPVLENAVVHFLRHPLTQHLPRKFKISFSGCEHDCAQGMMHDLGVVAVRQGKRHGFRIMAGGGLGHKPRTAITVDEFVEEQDLLPAMEAVVSMHHRYSDRVKRAKSRIKFLVDRFGPEGFVEKYREEYARSRATFENRLPSNYEWRETAPGEACGAGAPRRPFTQRQPGLSVFPIHLPLGDIGAAPLRGIARLMQDEGLDDIRATQDQNLMLLNVPTPRVDTVRATLAALGLGNPIRGDDVVACPGTSTCRLGITSSRVVAARLNGSGADLRVRVSGCHNGCAQPETGDIGLYGEGRRLHGKLVPHYQTYFGGDGCAGGGLGFKGPSVPTARIEEAVTRVQQAFLRERADHESFFRWAHRRTAEFFNDLLADLTLVTPAQLAEVVNDHGERDHFRVLQLGGGECAGATQESNAARFAEAAHERNGRDALRCQRKYGQAMECVEAIARLVGQSLLPGPAPSALVEIADAVRRSYPQSPHLADDLAALARCLAALRTNFDETRFDVLVADLDVWTVAAARTCEAGDPQLDLSAYVPSAPFEENSGIGRLLKNGLYF